LTCAGGSKPIAVRATISVWSPYVAQALRLDLAKGRQPRCRVLVGRHRFHRKLHIPGASGRTFRADGARNPKESISLVATLASTAGGIAGYYLGHFAYSEIAKPILALYGKLEAFEQLRSSASKDAVLLMLVTSGLAHLPPIKVVTILSGVVGVNIWLFIASCLVARGARFFVLAWAFERFGEPIRHFIERRLGLIAGVIAAFVIVLYLIVRYAL
jgi:membrane protein YqaA with SNARE-associated domain